MYLAILLSLFVTLSSVTPALSLAGSEKFHLQPPNPVLSEGPEVPDLSAVARAGSVAPSLPLSSAESLRNQLAGNPIPVGPDLTLQQVVFVELLASDLAPQSPAAAREILGFLMNPAVTWSQRNDHEMMRLIEASRSLRERVMQIDLGVSETADQLDPLATGFIPKKSAKSVLDLRACLKAFFQLALATELEQATVIHTIGHYAKHFDLTLRPLEMIETPYLPRAVYTLGRDSKSANELELFRALTPRERLIVFREYIANITITTGANARRIVDLALGRASLSEISLEAATAMSVHSPTFQYWLNALEFLRQRPSRDLESTFTQGPGLGLQTKFNAQEPKQSPPASEVMSTFHRARSLYVFTPEELEQLELFASISGFLSEVPDHVFSPEVLEKMHLLPTSEKEVDALLTTEVRALANVIQKAKEIQSAPDPMARSAGASELARLDQQARRHLQAILLLIRRLERLPETSRLARAQNFVHRNYVLSSSAVLATALATLATTSYFREPASGLPLLATVVLSSIGFSKLYFNSPLRQVKLHVFDIERILYHSGLKLSDEENEDQPERRGLLAQLVELSQRKTPLCEAFLMAENPDVLGAKRRWKR